MSEDFFGAAPAPPSTDPLHADLIDMITSRDYATPRHRQRTLGPSDVAHPCLRRMAYGMLEVPTCNPQFDPLPSIIGTATHTWLQSAATNANMVLGRQRWLTETRVNVTPGLAGSCDLFDTDTHTVIDWKVPGTNRFNKYRKDPGPVYKGQVFLYGKGIENAGHRVDRVAIAFLPRGGFLKSLHIWSADYDATIADQILARRNAVIEMTADLDVEHRPERFAWIPTTPYDCEFCPWWATQPKDEWECKGEVAT